MRHALIYELMSPHKLRKTNLSVIETDVLVLGSGAAGLRAAAVARESGAGALIASRSRLGLANNTAISYSGLSLPGSGSSADSEDVLYQDTMEAGRWINQPALVRLLAGNIAQEVRNLQEIGVVFLTQDDGSYQTFARGGHSHPRRIATRNRIGSNLTKPLRSRAKQLGAQVLENMFGIKILVDDGRFRGLLLCSTGGELLLVSAKALVLATGGGGALYQATSNTADMIGDGYGLAFQAGARLRDMEFIQFILNHERSRGVPARIPPFEEFLLHGALLRNSEGKVLLSDQDPVKVTRAMWMQAVAKEISEGRDRDGCVMMDLHSLADDYRSSLLHNHARSLGQDDHFLTRNQLLFRPNAHFFMGGIRVQDDLQTDIQGVYAAGEVMGGVHGANRLGGNALAETLVFGALAGEKAAQWSKDMPSDKLRDANIKPLIEEMDAHIAEPGSEGDHDLQTGFDRLRGVMSRYGAVLRNRNDLLKALDELGSLRSHFPHSPAPRASLARLMGLKNAVCTAEIILKAALHRRETRGAHVREDFHTEKDNWRCSFMLHNDHPRSIPVF